jgi:AcrR family transcriptional regulator
MTTASAKRPNLLSGERLPSKPAQARSLIRRERLKVAGLALFGEKGFQRTSVDDIVRRAKVPVGSFYQHFRSKRQLLLSLMDELLEKLSQLHFEPQGFTDVRAGIRHLLSRAFAHDLRYLGAYRAWQEALLSDPALDQKQKEIHLWTTARVARVFEFLQELPGARKGADVQALAKAMDSFLWSLLARAGQMSKSELEQWIDSATHLMYHAAIKDRLPLKRAK